MNLFMFFVLCDACNLAIGLTLYLLKPMLDYLAATNNWMGLLSNWVILRQSP